MYDHKFIMLHEYKYIVLHHYKSIVLCERKYMVLWPRQAKGPSGGDSSPIARKGPRG